MDASELHARRLTAKEVLTPMKGDNFMFPVADGTAKNFGGDRPLRPSTLIRDRLERGEEQEVFRGESDEHSSPNPLQDDSTRDDAVQKPRMTFGQLRRISFAAITWNPESNFMCRKKNHFLFRWSPSTLPELLIRHLMYCWKNILMIVTGT